VNARSSDLFLRWIRSLSLTGLNYPGGSTTLLRLSSGLWLGWLPHFHRTGLNYRYAGRHLLALAGLGYRTDEVQCSLASHTLDLRSCLPDTTLRCLSRWRAAATTRLLWQGPAALYSRLALCSPLGETRTELSARYTTHARSWWVCTHRPSAALLSLTLPVALSGCLLCGSSRWRSSRDQARAGSTGWPAW
jgi:hypothetical protein